MQMPVTFQQMQWPLVIGIVIAAGTFLTAVSRIVHVVKSAAAPFREFISEHDVLWEDYNIRTGGNYRRSTGRGAPPEPEEFYRNHPGAADGE